jgi:hypothetical protein
MGGNAGLETDCGIAKAALIVANRPFLCHKPTFVARLIKGCRGDAKC